MIVKRNRGFSLLELLTVLAIVGILALIAFPAYQSNMRTAKRSDAIEALIRIQVAQETWRISDTDYASLAELGNPTTAEGFYSIAVSAVSATGYTITATGVDDQVNDAACTSITLAVSAGGESKTPAVCW
jgi:type IV pilus assembly protein PilE